MVGPERLNDILAEGKTKIIRATDNPFEVSIENTDRITAGDGEKMDVIAGKGTLATQTTVNVFRQLVGAGIANHYLRRESDNTFRAKRALMIPIELVTRRVAFGSFVKRNPSVKSQTRFDQVAFETYGKDDSDPDKRNRDPLLIYNFEEQTVSRYRPKEPINTESFLGTSAIEDSPFALTIGEWFELKQLSVVTFELLEDIWAKQDVTLADLKVEAGRDHLRQLMIADVIDNDSWRIWPGGDPNNMVDKELYRDGKPLDFVKDKYAWVAHATEAFNS